MNKVKKWDYNPSSGMIYEHKSGPFVRLSDLTAGGVVEVDGVAHHLVPWTPEEERWGFLARDIMMAFDMNCKTPRKLFEHLNRCGTEIPHWMRTEPELINLDHTISKGTRCVLIYRAMIGAKL